MTIPFWKHGNRFRSILYQLDKMETYIDLIQSSIFDNISVYKDFMEKTLPDEEKAELYDNEYFDAEAQITKRNDELKRIFYASFLMSWYSFAKNQLSELGKNLESKYDSKGGLIGKYRITPTHWNEYKIISKLRNKIVHDSRGRLKYKVDYDVKTIEEYRKEYGKTDIQEFDVGTLIWIRFEKNFDRSTFQYSQKHQLLSFIEDGLYIVPNDKYSKHLINFGREFFMKIHDDLYRIEKSSKLKL